MSQNVRVTGSGFTTFNFRGQPLMYLSKIADSGQKPYASGSPVEGIIPIGARHPIEVVTSRVLNFGTLEITVWEKWDGPAWWQIPGLEGTNDIVEVYERLANEPADVTCQTIIKPPNGRPWRGKTYMNVIITDIDDSENVDVGGMSVPRSITCAYTHTKPISQAVA